MGLQLNHVGVNYSKFTLKGACYKMSKNAQ
jgi:hypothetical protein